MEAACSFLRNCPPLPPSSPPYAPPLTTDSFMFVFTSVRVPGECTGVETFRAWPGALAHDTPYLPKPLAHVVRNSAPPAPSSETQATFSSCKRCASSETMARSCPFPAPPTRWASRPITSRPATSSTTTWVTYSSQIARQSVVAQQHPAQRITTETWIVAAETCAIAAAAPSGSTLT